MKTMSISGARERLPAVIDEVVETRETVVLTRYGAPLVSISPLPAAKTKEARYPLRGHAIAIADDFDAPMPELWNALAVAEGRSEYPVRKRRASRGRKRAAACDAGKARI
jgi:antitoxin (DNA-binding transcriptional repressor) of toxin-antitoxin stability system